MNEKGLKWHQATTVSLCQYLHTNAACGLSRKAARSRLKKQGRNSLFDGEASKNQNHVKSLLLDPALLLMLFSALLAIVFLPSLQIICIAAALLLLIAVFLRFLYRRDEFSRIITQYRIPVVRVLRDGKVLKISAARVVVGDILLLRTGDVVPGDCRLLTAQELRVLTLLPNEKGQPTYAEYRKNADLIYPTGSRIDAPLAENMLYGGSEILCGRATAVVVAIGANSYLGAMQSFVLPLEIKEKRERSPLSKVLEPYLRLWGFLTLILLTLLTLIGLFTKPTGGSLAEYFFVLCILTAASSPAIISLYLKWISLRSSTLCLESDPPKNRAIIKSEAGMGKLAGLTDLFVIGKRGLCDGITHFWSAFVSNREIRTNLEEKKTVLHPLCEAILLRYEAETRTPTYDNFVSFENGNVFLSELITLADFDAGALKVRLQAVERSVHPQHPSWQCVSARLQEGRVRYLFDNSGTLMRHCMVYIDGNRVCAITPEYRSALRKYCEYVEENGCHTLCVARESGDGTLCLIGILALREQVSAVLPSVIEELSQSGIVARFFLSNDDYARACRLPEPYLYCNSEHPSLTPALLQRYRTFIGFGKEELSALLPTLQKSAHRIAVLGGNAEDRCFLRAGVLTFACDTVADLKYYAENHVEEDLFEDGREGSHNTSQVLRRHADVIVERADRFSGGTYAALQAISHSREAEARTRMLLQFWIHSQLARIVMTLLSVCIGVGFFSVLQMFLSSFAVEIAALCFFADVPIAQSALRRPNATSTKFIFNALSIKSLLPTIVSAGISAILAGILTLTRVITGEMTQTYLFFSLFLLQISLLCRITYRAKAIPQQKKTLTLSMILVCAIGVLTLLSVLISPFGAVTGMGSWTSLTAALLPLCPTIYFILTLILPFFSRTAK